MKHRHLPRTSGTTMNRQVLRWNTTRAAPHPWRARLRAAMDGAPSTPTADARRERLAEAQAYALVESLRILTDQMGDRDDQASSA